VFEAWSDGDHILVKDILDSFDAASQCAIVAQTVLMISDEDIESLPDFIEMLEDRVYGHGAFELERVMDG
jgi:hypothetical protein